MNDLRDLSVEFLLPKFKAFDGYTFHGACGIGDLHDFKFGRKDVLVNEKIV